MKGITHFTFGLSLGTFFKSLVQKAITFSSIDLVWGGIGGYLPDFLDFKFYKFIEKWDFVIEPTERNPEKILNTIKSALELADKKEGKEIKVKLHTVQLAPDLWQRYEVVFKNKERKILSIIGPSVTTSQIPYPEEQEPEKKSMMETNLPFEYKYDKPVTVDIFTGPSLSFKKVQKKIEIEFLPWHRKWTHSFTIGALLSLFVGLFLYIIKSPNYFLNALIFFLGYASHVFLDQLGFMGSNLFYPFTKKRTSGFKLGESIDPVNNFSFMWLSVGIILMNMNRFSPEPPIPLNPLQFFIFLVVLPPFIFISFSRAIKERKMEHIEIEEEMEDPFKGF